MTRSNSGVIRSVLSYDGVLSLAPTGVVLNGSTSGTATLYQFMSGTYKLVFIMFVNFRNGGGSAQTIALPTPFTTGESWYNGGTCPIQLVSLGSAQTVGVVTTLAAGGGSVTLQTTINKYSVGDNFSGFDTISIPGSQPSAFSGIFRIEGV
jgi:hypothetical protein